MNVKELVDGSQSQILDETIDNDTLYNVKDRRPIVMATNTQMTKAYTDFGLVQLNDVVFCTDNGTYLAGHFYQYNGYAWVHLGYLQYKDIPQITSAISSSSTNAEGAGAKAVYDQLQLKENTANKSTTLNASSTTTQYPASKTVYDYTNQTFAQKSAIEIRSV